MAMKKRARNRVAGRSFAGLTCVIAMVMRSGDHEIWSSSVDRELNSRLFEVLTCNGFA